DSGRGGPGDARASRSARTARPRGSAIGAGPLPAPRRLLTGRRAVRLRPCPRLGAFSGDSGGPAARDHVGHSRGRDGHRLSNANDAHGEQCQFPTTQRPTPNQLPIPNSQLPTLKLRSRKNLKLLGVGSLGVGSWELIGSWFLRSWALTAAAARLLVRDRRSRP